jgi:hypothetical protein
MLACLIAVSAALTKAAPISLLHRGALKVSEASIGTQKTAGARNPAPRGHMLTDHELNLTESVACLQARQRDPGFDCSLLIQYGQSAGWKGDGQLNAGNYPSWADPLCHSDGHTYFCDPENLLTTTDREEVLKVMKEQRESHYITCGPQVQHDPIDKWNYQPFYLGVAIADNWPLQESDPSSLQAFGQILAGRWNMTFPWDGNPAFSARCPNQGILIILPRYRQAYFSSSSCEFLCPTKGGPEVAAATIGNMNYHSLAAGVKAGVQQVYTALKETSPMHPVGWEPVENTSGTWGGMPYGSAPQVSASTDAWIWNWAQRIIFAVAVVVLAGSVVLAILVCVMAPGMNRDLNKSVV